MTSVTEERLGLESAFPMLDHNGNNLVMREPGLTKRELLAAMAMQALISKAPLENLDIEDPGHLPQEIASGAVDYADELLKELVRG